MKETLRLEELLPLMEAAFAAGGSFRFVPMGQSMEPTIHGGRDTVILIPPENLKVGDVVLFRRRDGGFVLHRIIRIREQSFDTQGDNRLNVETGISREQALAKLDGIIRNHRVISVNSAGYRGRLHLTLMRQRLRGFLHAAGSPLKRAIFKRKNSK